MARSTNVKNNSKEYYGNNNNHHRCRRFIVFFEGTANHITSPTTTQIGIFYQSCKAIPLDVKKLMNDDNDDDVIKNILSSNNSEDDDLKIGFDGCGITNGTPGLLFAFGLDEQCQLVSKIVSQILEHQQSNKKKNKTNDCGLHVVAIGLSRGGIACCKLARLLAKQKYYNDITLSLLLYDPVPGNAVWTGFPYTGGLFYSDLRPCKDILRNVLAIYPYMPLPDLTMHAPSLLLYPKTSNNNNIIIEEDVTLGCHQGALYSTKRHARYYDEHEMACNLSCHRIFYFLQQEDITVEFPNGFYVPSIQDCFILCQRALLLANNNGSSRRITHDATWKGRTIIRRNEDEQRCQYLNKHHVLLESLVAKEAKADDDSSGKGRTRRRRINKNNGRGGNDESIITNGNIQSQSSETNISNNNNNNHIRYQLDFGTSTKKLSPCSG